MSKPLVVLALLLALGSWLLMREMRWFGRIGVADRLRPYVAGGPANRNAPVDNSVATFATILAPAVESVGDRIASLFGGSETLARQLERIHSPLSTSDFRLRQLGWSVVGFAFGSIVVALVRPPAPLALLALLAAPLIAFLLVEFELNLQSKQWQRRVTLELPVVSEQLAMLLSSGYSLGAGLGRLAARSNGAIARDLRRVVNRIQQGLDETQALREWSDLVRVNALDRLVSVLAMNREASDLGRLITDEARVCRSDIHRGLIEQIERRGQQVWIPVTVATLVPGVLFLAVPFAQALQLFASG
jgi:tight adherence protein C